MHGLALSVLALLLLLGLGVLPGATHGASCAALERCGPCTNPPSQNVSCIWCGDSSTGVCLERTVLCPPNKRDLQTVNGQRCPPSARQIVLPMVVLYLVLAVAVIAQHAYACNFAHLPVNNGNSLNDFGHLRTRDARLVGSYGEHAVLYADYARPRNRHEQFVSMLASVSIPVIFIVLMQERLGYQSYVFSIGWWLVCAYMLLAKALRRPRVFVLREDAAVIVGPKHCGLCGVKESIFAPDEMPFVSVRSYKDGTGSVFFATEDARPDATAAVERYVGFQDIFRSEEVYQLVVRWRCRLLSQPVPSVIQRTPEREATTCELGFRYLIYAFLLGFVIVFCVLFYRTSNQAAAGWLIGVLVPFIIIWIGTAVFYAYQRYRVARRRRTGFLILDQQFSDLLQFGPAPGAPAAAEPAARAQAGTAAQAPAAGHASTSEDDGDSASSASASAFSSDLDNPAPQHKQQAVKS